MPNQQAIPKKLFPLVDGEYTIEWAKKTFPYAHMFSKQFTALIPKLDEVEAWRNKALQLRKAICDEGNEAGKEKVLSVAIHKYNLTMPDCNGVSPKCIQDVLSIISDKIWYNTEKDIRLEQLYMMIYGIKKVGFNQWAVDLETNWLKRNNLVYISSKEVKDPMYNTRGCVYSLIIQVFGNTNSKRFKEIMWRNHGEYIMVRNKQKKSETGDNIDIVRRVCTFGNMYLCSKKKTQELPTGSEKNENLKSFPMLHDYGKYWVKKILRCGMEIKTLHRHIDLWKEDFDQEEIKKGNIESKSSQHNTDLFNLCTCFFKI